MSRILIPSIILVLVLGGFPLTGAFGNGLILPGRIESGEFITSHAPGTESPVSVRHDHVTVRIDDRMATTTVNEVFQNETDRPIEATCIFPLPEGAAVTDFAMWVGEDRMEGKILEADESRTTYESIVRKMRDPAILQFTGQGSFRAKVFPIPARGEKRVRFQYTEVLDREEGVGRYRYVMNTSRFFRGPIGEFSIAIRIHSAAPLRNIFSTTHDVTIEEISENEADVRFKAKDYAPNHDFTLCFSASEDLLGLRLIAHREKGEDGFFLLMGKPGMAKKEDQIARKDLVFALDTSGSMRGEKLEQAKEALLYCLENLNRGDRFNVVAFSSDVRPFRETLVKANEENLKAAREFVEDLVAKGGTNIGDALPAALRGFDRTNRERMVLFLTDGVPTQGVTDPQQILKRLAESNPSELRIFVFGVGYDVNAHLLDRIAEDTDAFTTYVQPEQDIDVEVASLYRKLSYPVLGNVGIEFEGVVAHSIYPKKFPSLFRGQEIFILGRYRGKGEATVKVSGQLNGETQEYAYRTNFPTARNKNEFIPPLWAARKIGFLAQELRLHGEDKELIEELVALSKEYGIVTEYTSFLVNLDRDIPLAELNDRVRYNLANANNVTFGQWAVNQAMNDFAMQNRVNAVHNNMYVDAHGNRQVMTNVQNMGRRAYYNRGGVWNDSRVSTESAADRRVALFSDEYFQLSRNNSEMARAQALGGNVRLQVGEEVIEFYAEGNGE